MAGTGREVLCRCGNSSREPFCDVSPDGETPAAFTPNPWAPSPQVVED